MKIYNADKIIPGLLIFVCLMTLPFWYAHGKAASRRRSPRSTPRSSSS